jgi:sugar lactone lactonase YvrE
MVGSILAGCASMEASTPGASAPPDIAINGSMVFPESITHDAAGNLYNGSVPGIIYRTRPGSRTAEPFIVPSGQNGIKSLLGVFVNDARSLLWTCSNPNFFAQPPETGVSSLLAFDLASGSLSGRPPEGRSGPAACNDIAIDTDGTVWASETSGGRIFVLRPGANELELFAKGEELVGIDGLAFAGDGTLYINNVRQHLFQRVERNVDGTYVGLTNVATPEPLNGPDGLRSLGGNRFIQAEGPGGRVAILTVDGDAATMVPVTTGLSGSVGVTAMDGVAYVTEGRIEYLFDPNLRGQDPGTFYIRAFRLP